MWQNCETSMQFSLLTKILKERAFTTSGGSEFQEFTTLYLNKIQQPIVSVNRFNQFNFVISSEGRLVEGANVRKLAGSRTHKLLIISKHNFKSDLIHLASSVEVRNKEHLWVRKLCTK